MKHEASRYLLIVNGKSSSELALRNAVYRQRKAGMKLTVRVTWEEDDAAVFAERAGQSGFTHVIAGGGDGTVNGVVNGLMRLPKEQRPVLGIVPLGSANDFARSLGLPLAPQQVTGLRMRVFPDNKMTSIIPLSPLDRISISQQHRFLLLIPDHSHTKSGHDVGAIWIKRNPAKTFSFALSADGSGSGFSAQADTGCIA